jgi:hypothetical protein
MPTLFLKCRSCAVEFPTPIALTSESIQANILISGLEHACPACGARDQFFTADYFLPKEGAPISTEAPAPAAVSDHLPTIEAVSVPIAASTATIGGDLVADGNTELQSMAGRLAAYGVRGGPGSPMEGSAPPHDSEAGE